MGYLDENGLARYDGLLKNWVTFKSGTVDGIDPLLNWQKTETAGAVAFYPLPAAPLDPVVNFVFTEIDPILGTKDFDNPSTITGVSAITITRCETAGVDSTDYTIDLGEIRYGGSLNVATGIMTITKEFITLNTISVSDGIVNGNAVFRAWPELLGILKPINDETEVCEELPRVVNGTGINRFFVGIPVNGNCPIHVVLNSSLLDLSRATDSNNPTATEVRDAGIAYLNTHPLHMVLSLETPYTVQLTPLQIYSLFQSDLYTPRLNTIYSDQMSVQVGYPKSPQVV